MKKLLLSIGLLLSMVTYSQVPPPPPGLSIKETTVYPNPSEGEFKIQTTSSLDDTLDVKMYDMDGREVKRFLVSKNNLNEYVIDSNLSTGVYLMVIIYDNKREVKKVIVK